MWTKIQQPSSQKEDSNPTSKQRPYVRHRYSMEKIGKLPWSNPGQIADLGGTHQNSHQQEIRKLWALVPPARQIQRVQP